MARSTRILGRDLLRAVLKKIPKNAQVELQKAMTESGNKLAARQKQLVPVREGTLRDSIRVEPFSKGGIGALVKAGGPTTTKPVRNGQSATYDYAMAVELGVVHQLAQPFFFTAYRQTKPAIKRRATIAVKKAVADAVK